MLCDDPLFFVRATRETIWFCKKLLSHRVFEWNVEGGNEGAAEGVAERTLRETLRKTLRRTLRGTLRGTLKETPRRTLRGLWGGLWGGRWGGCWGGRWGGRWGGLWSTNRHPHYTFLLSVQSQIHWLQKKINLFWDYYNYQHQSIL